VYRGLLGELCDASSQAVEQQPIWKLSISNTTSGDIQQGVSRTVALPFTLEKSI
jgi:hypothetical protein